MVGYIVSYKSKSMSYYDNRMKNIIPVSDLQRLAAQLLNDVNDSSEPVIITQRGRARGVLLSAKHYEQIEEDMALLDELELEKLVREGLEDKAADRLISLEEAKKRLHYPG